MGTGGNLIRKIAHLVKPSEPFDDLNQGKMADDAKKAAFEAQKMADGIPRYSDQNLTEKLMHKTVIRDGKIRGPDGFFKTAFDPTMKDLGGMKTVFSGLDIRGKGFVQTAFQRMEVMPLAYVLTFGLMLSGLTMARGLLYNPDVNINRER